MFVRLLVSACLFMTLGLSSTSEMGAQPMQHHTPYDDMEAKAKLAKSLQESAVRDLAHEVLTQPHYYKLPTPVSSLLEDKLTLAEVNFRRGENAGVTEAQLTTLLNSIRDRLRLPQSHTVTPQQVRTLRMKLAIMMPHTMGDTLSGSEIRKGDHVHTTMSPLQAMNLILVMMDQKVANPDYQDPGIDLVAKERARQTSRDQNTKMALRLEKPETSQKNRQIRSDVSAALHSMSSQDAYEVVYQALQTLHLNRNLSRT